MFGGHKIYSETISVLVVDDSLTSRALITLALKRNPKIKVVGTAGTPLEAKDLILKLKPDVLTLDVEMPGMNGLQFLEKIMRLRPMPVVMVSSLLAARSEMVEMACRLGAVECFSKSSGEQGEGVFVGLADAVVRAASQRVNAHLGVSTGFSGSSDFIVAIGASTGGVEALGEVLGSFPEDCPPTVIVQHMPQQFSKNFARRLNSISRPEVCLATDGCKLARGKVFIAPGGEMHTEVSRTGRMSPYSCHLVSGPPLNGHRPSVDALFFSIAQAAGRHAVGVILTGMETDGARGLLAMRQSGARTIGQDRNTSIIYGMPKAAFECGAVEVQLPLSEIGPSVLRLAENRTQESH
ncbi:protein-glutamate methylesterase/protein-glutamine glutaminase [Gluconobacter thailandicus]|uniref:Protein-glutamate methylesterase/protein-glutamine glutaminase n=1 Tax=Gluconobacter thailandicus TaxID=257438 RepID=A0AAP9ES08_GLUTH|nr:chemotaxis response regulator protein-glutamate methylesterase [Gluconobacter thailandicus]KXV32447.1 chemotaxis protein [Gluconobacter thailandicus]QEH96251.1 chemotaxis response regulator protein-glutamate methylesterase [Gluconobacter thailandicus]